MEINEDTSASRILAVLDALAQPTLGHSTGLSVSELARTIGRDKSSVSRQLKSLISLGLVEKSEEGKHILGWRVFTIAARAGDQRLLLLAPAVMRQLGRVTKERVHLSIRRQDEVLTIHTEGPLQALGAMGWVGRAVPVLGTSSGRALMMDDSDDEIRAVYEHASTVDVGPRFPQTSEEAILRVAQARSMGYVITVDEYEEGLSAVAAPIRDANGRITAAINVSAPTFRITGRMNDFARLLQRAATHLSRSISTPVPTVQTSATALTDDDPRSNGPARRQAS